jgi:hypothetical protein
MTQPLQLGKHEPDPMAAFSAIAQFGQDGGVHVFLCVDKSLQVISICGVHDNILPTVMSPASFAG